jgi:hypothetical protein
MAEKERGGGVLTDAAGQMMKAAQGSSIAARPAFVEDQGTAWMAKELRAQIAPASMVERQRLGSSGGPAHARRRLSCGNLGEADSAAVGSLELEGDP